MMFDALLLCKALLCQSVRKFPKKCFRVKAAGRRRRHRPDARSESAENPVRFFIFFMGLAATVITLTCRAYGEGKKKRGYTYGRVCFA
jgi:hypothetical protein